MRSGMGSGLSNPGGLGASRFVPLTEIALPYCDHRVKHFSLMEDQLKPLQHFKIPFVESIVDSCTAVLTKSGFLSKWIHPLKSNIPSLNSQGLIAPLALTRLVISCNIGFF